MEQQKELDACIDRLEEVVQQMIRRVHAELDHHLVQGLTGSQFFVMNRLYRRGRMMVSEVAEEMGVSLSAVTALVDRLHRAGFVERVRDENDRRVVWLAVTPRGEEVLLSCQGARRKVLKRYFGQLSLDNLKYLIGIYEKLIAILQREGAGVPSGRRCCALHLPAEDSSGEAPG